MDSDKKKRSPNYTADEKEQLLVFVAKYKDIIENKRTGAFYIQKKKDAWAVITQQFNSICTTGPRDESMLKHFYNNMKHRARKVTASENKQRYLSELPPEVSGGNNVENIQHFDIMPIVEQQSISDAMVIDPQFTYSENIPMVDSKIIKDLKKKWTDEKKNIRKTGGGSFEPILTETDNQMLSILDSQIRPDQNPFDDAAEYFGESNELNMEEPPTHMEIKTKTTFKKIKKKNIKIESRNKSAELLKRIYFKKKIELVYYQKKNEMLKFTNEKARHMLQMKILKKQLEKADKD